MSDMGKGKYLGIRAWVLAVIFLAGVTGAVMAGDPSAGSLLKTDIDRILDLLRDPDLKAEDKKEVRRNQLRKIARQRFDFRRMSMLSLGRHWRDRTDLEKDEFTDLFSDLLEATYMARIESYTDEKVVFVKERVKKKKNREYAKIQTKIVTQTVEIPINYMMHRQGNAPWRVYDLVIEGVSMVNNYRSQFGQILEQESFTFLVEKLKVKTD